MKDSISILPFDFWDTKIGLEIWINYLKEKRSEIFKNEMSEIIDDAIKILTTKCENLPYISSDFLKNYSEDIRLYIYKNYKKYLMKKTKEVIENLIIEKLSQLENGELDNSPAGKELAELIKKDEVFFKIYEKYKNEKNRN